MQTTSVSLMRSMFPHVVLCAALVATAAMHGGAQSQQPLITPLLHSSVQIEYGGKVIQVDPWSLMDLSRARPADLILITDDPVHHLDPAAISYLRKPGTPVVVPAKARDRVPEATVLENGQSATLSGIRVEALPAYDLKPGEPSHPKGQANGYLVTAGEVRLLFAGVTECVPEIRSLKNIDVAFIPVNLPLGRMASQAAADCVKAIRPKVVYPYHYDQAFVGRIGTGKVLASDNVETPAARGVVEDFRRALSNSGVEVRIGQFYPVRSGDSSLSREGTTSP
jgi:L-ascorbate metabolism protein UlaG (beta-lactamase superfamily)